MTRVKVTRARSRPNNRKKSDLSATEIPTHWRAAHATLRAAFKSNPPSGHIATDTCISQTTYLGHAVTIYPQAHIGEDCIIMDGAVIGRPPIPNSTVTRAVSVGFTNLTIGNRTIVGCNAVLYTGSQVGGGVLIGDLSSIREGCQIADAVVIGRGVMILYNCQIGARSRIQDQAHLVGDMIIEEDVFIGMGVMTTNDNDVYVNRFGAVGSKRKGPIIRSYAVVGAGATLIAGVEIGVGAMVAAGAVVTKNVPPWTLVAGVPARHIRDVPADWKSQARRQMALVHAKEKS